MSEPRRGARFFRRSGILTGTSPAHLSSAAVMATPDVLRCPRCFPSEAPAGIVRPAHAPDRPVEIELAGPQRWHSVRRSSPSTTGLPT